jgi:hypothetical protein
MKKVFVTVSFVFLISAVVFADGRDTLRLSTLITNIRYELNDIDSTTAFWSNAVLRDFIKESVRDVAAMGCIIKWDTVITTSGTRHYALNSDFMDIRPTNTQTGILIKTQSGWKAMSYRALKVVEQGDIPFGKDAPRTEPSSYMTSGQRIWVDPAGSGGDSIIIMYEAFANAMTGGDTATVDVPYEYKRLVVLGALKRALLMNRETETYVALAQSVEKEYGEKFAMLFRKSEPQTMMNIR